MVVVNLYIKTYFESKGIIHRLSCPKTPKQNGLAKCYHRQVIDIGLMFTAHSSIPSQFWIATFYIVVYLFNWLPTSIIQGQSPYEVLFQHLPSYSFLKIFCYTCYPYLTLLVDQNLINSIWYVFLGYSLNNKGYLNFDLKNGR